MDFYPHCDDGTLPRINGKLNEWYGYLKKATQTANRPIALSQQTKTMLHQAGFVDIKEEIIDVPINPWPKDPHKKTLGLYYTGWMEQSALESMSMQPLTLVEGKDPTWVRGLCGEASEDMKRVKHHGYNNL